MLKPETVELINALINDTLNSIRPTLIHLEFQMALKPIDRLINLEEDQMDEEIKSLRVTVRKLQNAQDDFYGYTSLAGYPTIN